MNDKQNDKSNDVSSSFRDCDLINVCTVQGNGIADLYRQQFINNTKMVNVWTILSGACLPKT